MIVDRKQQECQYRGGTQTADIHEGEALHDLSVSSEGRGHREHGQNRSQRGHEDRAKPRRPRLDQGILKWHFSPVLVDRIHVEDAVVYDGSDQHEKAEQGVHGQGGIKEPEEAEGSDQGEGDRRHDHDAVAHGFELRRHHDEDQEDRDGNRKSQCCLLYTSDAADEL